MWGFCLHIISECSVECLLLFISFHFLSFFIDIVILLRWFRSACPGYDRGVGCKRSEVIESLRKRT